ncbi:MAG: hypothetical protein M0T70_04435 [Geobacteraceae bacterium]|nr:hypothetical protein [Geobacteraceae bacterium]
MEYVRKVLLEINGQSITDFKTVTEGERTLRVPVKLMNKTGFATVTQRPTVQVDYVIPKDKPEFDFDSVEDGTLTIDYDNGTRITYSGICTDKIGSVKYDEDNDAVKQIDFIVTAGRVEE